jgi:hypothetical protein
MEQRLQQAIAGEYNVDVVGLPSGLALLDSAVFEYEDAEYAAQLPVAELAMDRVQFEQHFSTEECIEVELPDGVNMEFDLPVEETSEEQ